MKKMVNRNGRWYKARSAAIKINVLFLLVINLLPTGKAYAKFNWLDDPQTGSSAFDRPGTVIEETSQSLYGVIMAGCMAAMVIGAVTIGIGIAVGNRQRRSEAKSQLGRFIIAGVIIFGMLTFICGLAAAIAIRS